MVDSVTARRLQLLWLQNEPKSSSLYHCACQLIWGVCFAKCDTVHCVPNFSTLILSVQRGLFSWCCCLLRCNFANLSCAAMFFLKRRNLPLATIPNKLSTVVRKLKIIIFNTKNCVSNRILICIIIDTNSGVFTSSCYLKHSCRRTHTTTPLTSSCLLLQH